VWLPLAGGSLPHGEKCRSKKEKRLLCSMREFRRELRRIEGGDSEGAMEVWGAGPKSG
jgi:hypothetical protein